MDTKLVVPKRHNECRRANQKRLDPEGQQLEALKDKPVGLALQQTERFELNVRAACAALVRAAIDLGRDHQALIAQRHGRDAAVFFVLVDDALFAAVPRTGVCLRRVNLESASGERPAPLILMRVSNAVHVLLRLSHVEVHAPVAFLDVKGPAALAVVRRLHELSRHGTASVRQEARVNYLHMPTTHAHDLVQVVPVRDKVRLFPSMTVVASKVLKRR